MPLTIEQRRARLDREISKAIKDGWQLSFRDDTSAQFRRERKGSRLGCLTLGIFYWMFRNKNGMGLFLTVDEKGKVKRTMQK